MVKQTNEQTGKAAASAAGKILSDPTSTKAERKVAASALTQAPNRKSTKSKK